MRTRTLAIVLTAVGLLAAGCVSEPVEFMIDRTTFESGRERLDAAETRIGAVTYAPSGTDRTQVGRAAYSEDATLDLYYPPGFDFDDALPAVVVINGFAAVGETVLMTPDGTTEVLPAVDFQEADSFISLANALAASGFVAVVYGTSDDQTRALDEAMTWLHEHAEALRIDRNEIAVWMLSAHTLTGLRTVMDSNRDWAEAVSAAVVYYGWMPVDQFRTDLPVLAVKALRDEEFFIASMDEFITMARDAGTSVEYHEVDGPHSFDFEPGFEAATATMMERALGFLREA